MSPSEGRSGERRETAADNAERGGLRPKYRRAFGCVTWLYMGILAFLAAATLFALPLRYTGSGAGFGQVLSLLSFFGLILFLPAMVLGFVLGARTYRVENGLGARAGALIGAIAGWGCFFSLCWAAVAYGLGGRDQLFRPTLFASLEGSRFAFYAFAPVMLLAAALVLYALFARGAFERRRRLVLISAGLALLAGLLVVAAGFDPLGVAGALISTAAGAVGGWVSGIGYARAGGDDMIPPGSTIRPRGPRRPRRKPEVG